VGTLTAPVSLRQERTAVPNEQKAVWASDTVRTLRRGDKHFDDVGIQIPNRSARSITTNTLQSCQLLCRKTDLLPFS
jgi:hypothetical protein